MREIRRLANFLQPGEAFHIQRTAVVPRGKRAHAHDFAEIFWVVEGSGVHIVNEKRIVIREGHLVLVRSHDYHRYEPSNDLVYVNLAFPISEIRFLKERYFDEVGDFFGKARDVPQMFTLDDSTRAWMHMETEKLLRSDRGQADLDLFMIELFGYLYTPHREALKGEHVPEWMRMLLSAVRGQRIFSMNVHDIADMIGISAEHLARELRRSTHMSPIELLTEHRMRYAARELQLGDKSIMDISMDCGYASLSHFYRVFRNRFDTTPQRYRRDRIAENRTLIV